MAIKDALSLIDSTGWFKPGVNTDLSKDEEYQKRLKQREEAENQVINQGLDAGMSYEEIGSQTGIDLNRIRTFADSTRPGYGIQDQRSPISKAWSQINPLDSGRSWQIENPSQENAAMSLGDQIRGNAARLGANTDDVLTGQGAGTRGAERAQDSLVSQNTQLMQTMSVILNDPNASEERKRVARRVIQTLGDDLQSSGELEREEQKSTAQKGKELASSVFGGVEKVGDSVEALTGITERRLNHWQQQYNEGKISRKEYQRLLDQQQKDTEWAGSEDKGTLNRLKTAAGVSLEATPEIVPFLAPLKGYRAAQATVKGGALFGGLEGLSHSVGRELNNPEGFNKASVAIETGGATLFGAIAGKVATVLRKSATADDVYSHATKASNLDDIFKTGKVKPSNITDPNVKGFEATRGAFTTKGTSDAYLHPGLDNVNIVYKKGSLGSRGIVEYGDELAVKGGIPNKAIDHIEVPNKVLAKKVEKAGFKAVVNSSLAKENTAKLAGAGIDSTPLDQITAQGGTRTVADGSNVQSLLEKAHNAGDDVEVQRLLSTIDDPDLKVSMESVFNPSPQKKNLVMAAKTSTKEMSASVGDSPTLIGTAGKITENQSKLADTIEATYPHLKDSVHRFTHEVQSQKALSQYADDLVKADPVAAREIFDSGSLAQINPGAHIKLGEKLTHQAALLGDTKLMNQTIGAHQAALTNYSQGMRAAGQLNILKPDDVVVYAARRADKTGRPLSQGTVNALKKQAKFVSSLPEGPEKLRQMTALRKMAENDGLLRSGGKAVNKVAASFRATLASTDLSSMRQGGVAMTRYPGIGTKAYAKGARAAFDPDYFDQQVIELANLTDSKGTPLSTAFKRMKLSVNAIEGKTEEVFRNASLVEGPTAKKLGVGHVIEGSNRAYDLTLTDMRARIAKRIIDANGGVDELMKKWNTKQWQSLGRVIDTSTGVGRGGPGIINDVSTFTKIQPALSEGLFSAQLWKSRLDLLNPLYYGQVANNPVAFKLAVQSGLSFATTVGAVLGAAVAVGAKVETDMRSSDFGKIRVGNTRIDVMGGLQQNIVFAWRQLSGESKSSSTGNLSDLDDPNGYQSRLGVAGNLVTNKLTPVLSEILRQIKGEDIGYNKMDGGDRLKSVASNFIPLSIQGLYEGFMEDGPGGLALSATNIVGAGTGSYGPTEANWAEDDGKVISQFRDKYGVNATNQAADRFNRQYNEWLSSVNEEDWYRSKSIKEQQEERTKKKAEIKKDIFKIYNFKYEK